MHRRFFLPILYYSTSRKPAAVVATAFTPIAVPITTFAADVLSTGVAAAAAVEAGAAAAAADILQLLLQCCCCNWRRCSSRSCCQ